MKGDNLKTSLHKLCHCDDFSSHIFEISLLFLVTNHIHRNSVMTIMSILPFISAITMSFQMYQVIN